MTGVRGHFLAFDLGAESGRAMAARLAGDRLELREVHRFPNEPVEQQGALQWDVLRLWTEMRRAFERLNGDPLDAIGVDAWGCDYGLIGEDGQLLQNPYHYRDVRNDGVRELVTARIPAREIYDTTGIQFLTFNTLFQLSAALRATPRLLDAASAFLTIPDLFNYWLTGRIASEFTIATTTQLVDARTRTWAAGLMDRAGLPARLTPPLVEPGTILGGVLAGVHPAFGGVPVVAPACHDTGSAVAAIACGGGRAFLSSGTWSLLGTELDRPIITPRALELNFTNEGGVDGTTRLLKNIGGMWLLQGCRRAWAAAGQPYEYAELLAAASDERHAFRALVDPDHASFLHPSSMVAAIAAYCRDTRQPEPEGSGGYTRTILESLAFKYRFVVESIERLTGEAIEEIQVVGGGSRNHLLNQFTADATGRRVLAGPVEATALGNIAVQLVATGAAASLADARRIIAHSFPPERFEPSNQARWDAEYQRFQEYVELTCV